jgi:hypothetical protein
MPTAPTFTSVVSQTGFIQLSYANVGAGDHNQIWRSTSTEFDGTFIKIADSLPYLVGALTFNDYSVASGKVYTYYIVAVDSGGGTATSVTKSATLTLASGFLHSVRTSGFLTTNAIDAVALLDMIPHNRQYGLASTQYLLADTEVPTIGMGNIETVGVGLTNIIRKSQDANRQTIRDMFSRRGFVCLRDTRGNKFFGQLTYSEQYQFNTLLPISFQVLSFDESVSVL